MGDDERYYFELAYGGWGFEACVEFEVEEGRSMVCSVALAEEAGQGKDDREIREALEKQLRADMKERATLATNMRLESGWPEAPRGSVLRSLGYTQLSPIEGEPEHWRRTLDKL
ncbi:MAG: hypothetical protein ACYS0K_22010 [Planctomycetota bacterium]|jgi:hypothetical protein